MLSVATSTILSILTLTKVINADRPVDWFEINCPGSSGDQSCTYTNQNDVDIAVSLFFQTEDESSGSSFECIGGTRANLNINKPFTCPSPMVYQFKNYWSYCLLEDLTFPSDLSKVEEYCDYIDQGYEGFTFSKSDFPNYKCPSSMRQGENNDGTVFCTFDLPSTTTSNLPNDTQPFCTLQAFQNNELGFRFNNNGSTPTPTSHTDGTVYCSRAWNNAQQGSAGDCYFILPAKESFSCSGQGDTNIIGAHAVKLAKSNFDSTSTDISKSVSNYTNSNKDKDEWVYLEIESAGKNINSLQCSYETSNNAMINVCNFTAEAAASSRYSCNFALPAGKTMRCNQMGDIYVSSAIVRTMTSSIFNNEPISDISLCPNKTYPDSTFCDCAFENPSTTDDMLIIMEAVNMDNQFDSYHCYVWGVNMCAWGANNNNLNDAGGCYFVLPAGAMYNCSMQWGSTSFLSSTAIKLDGTLYTKPTAVSMAPSAVKPNGVKLPDSREYLEMEQLFYKWMARHDKHYISYAEEFERFKNFRQFVSLVDNNNNGIKVDEIKSESADLTMEEFNELYRDCAIPASMYDKERNAWKVPSSIDMDNLPTSVDWRTKGAVTPIKNQGQCGSCWAFSTTGVLESAWEILTGELQSLSEEDLVDCDTDDGNAGCGGGWPYKAITFVQKNGIDTEASYNYTAGNGNSGSCKSQDGQKADISGHVTGYQFVESDEDAMAAYVANYGPISISLDAMTQLWWPYNDKSGIMTGCCNKEVDHAVLIVGYGTGSKSNISSSSDDASMPYWIIKNSWGTDWGYDGYIYLQRGTDQCGITYQPVVPTLKK